MATVVTLRRVGVVAAVAASLALAAGCGSTKTVTVTRTVTVTAPSTAKAKAVVAQKAPVPAFRGDPKATKDPRRDGLKALAALPKATSAGDQTVTPHLSGTLDPGNQSLPQYMATIGDDVATFWEGLFNQSGYKWDPIQEDILATGQGTTKCNPGTFGLNDGPFYCSADPSIHLPVGFFATVAAPIGDDAVAIVIAHEWGHRVQDELGAFHAGFKSRQIELSADCLGGVWSHSVYQRHLLSDGDISEATKITTDAGDAPGTDETAPGAHGSSTERVAAFIKGFQSGAPNDCAPGKFS